MNNLVVEDSLAGGVGDSVLVPASGLDVRSVAGGRHGNSLVVQIGVLLWILLLGGGLFFEVGAVSANGITLSKGGGWPAVIAFFAISAALFVLSFRSQKVPKVVLLGALALLTVNLGMRSHAKSSALGQSGGFVLTRLEEDALGAKTRILAKRLTSVVPGSATSTQEVTTGEQERSSAAPLWVDWSLVPSSESEARRLLHLHPSLGGVLYGSSHRLKLVLPESSLQLPFGASRLSLIDSAPIVVIGGRNEAEVAAFTAELVAALSIGPRARSQDTATQTELPPYSHDTSNRELAHLKSAYNLSGTWFSAEHQALVALKIGNRLLVQALTLPYDLELLDNAQVWLRSAAKRIHRGDNHELRQAVRYSQALAALFREKLLVTHQTTSVAPANQAQIQQSQIQKSQTQPHQIQPQADINAGKTINAAADINDIADVSAITDESAKRSERSKNKELRQRLRYFANGIRDCEQSFLNASSAAQSSAANTSPNTPLNAAPNAAPNTTPNKTRKKGPVKKQCFVPRWFYQDALANFKAFK